MPECLHMWVLDRPESDTWECLDCGSEGSGYPPADLTVPPDDPICNERGVAQSECPAYCLHGLSTPPGSEGGEH